jgi:alkylation response protein AidB-like acyl-CoA dehydrogenase
MSIPREQLSTLSNPDLNGGAGVVVRDDDASNPIVNTGVDGRVSEVLDRAAALIPVLRARSAHCEKLRQIPQETVDDFRASGILRCAQPVAFGGMGGGTDIVCELAMEIGRGCGSSGWMAGQWAGHNFMVSWFGPEAQDEFWSGDLDVLSSTANAIVEYSSEVVADGLRFTGRFKFSSGVDHAEWILLATPDGMCLVPRSDFVVIDDWFVAGLRGTGSKSIEMRDVFVPAHRIIPLQAMADGKYPGLVRQASPYHRLPAHLALNPMIVSQVIGMAIGAVEIFDERARGRTDPHTREPAVERPGNQLAFAESSAEVDSARTLLRETLRELAEWGECDMAGVSLEQRAQIRRDLNFAVRLCVRAVDRLVEVGDSSALYEVNLLHRWARDVRAAALQWSVHWEEPAMQYSRVRWGLPPQTRLV